jgi:hypothetical protein
MAMQSTEQMKMHHFKVFLGDGFYSQKNVTVRSVRPARNVPHQNQWVVVEVKGKGMRDSTTQDLPLERL